MPGFDRSRVKVGALHGAIHRGNKKAVVFVHGLGGNITQRYWGDLIRLLEYDRQLTAYDLFFYGYASSKRWDLSRLLISSDKERLSSIPEIFANLASDTTLLRDTLGYRDVSFIGHSLGGLVTMGACSELTSNTASNPPAIKSVCLLETPLTSPCIAKAAFILVSFGTNPHLRFLSKEACIAKTLRSGFEALKAMNSHARYMYCIGDTLVPLHRLYCQQNFTETTIMQGPHKIMNRIKDRQSGNYQTLVAHIVNRC